MQQLNKFVHGESTGLSPSPHSLSPVLLHNKAQDSCWASSLSFTLDHPCCLDITSYLEQEDLKGRGPCVNSRDRQTWVTFLPCHFLAVWPGASHLTLKNPCSQRVRGLGPRSVSMKNYHVILAKAHSPWTLVYSVYLVTNGPSSSLSPGSQSPHLSPPNPSAFSWLETDVVLTWEKPVCVHTFHLFIIQLGPVQSNRVIEKWQCFKIFLLREN